MKQKHLTGVREPVDSRRRSGAFVGGCLVIPVR